MKKSSAGDVNKGRQLQGLQGLPAELLNAVLCLLDASSQEQVFMTSKLLATALLQISPRIQLTYPTESDISAEHLRELAPFLTDILQNRQQQKLHLTLRPVSRCTEAKRRRAWLAAAADADCLLAWMLEAVPLCGAVDCLTISWHKSLHLPWEPDFSEALADSFPSLTSLTFKDANISIRHLAKAIKHPLLLPRLLHLDLQHVTITHEGDLGRSPFLGSRLQELSLHGFVEVEGEPEFLSGLLPLPPTLTQLAVNGMYNVCQRDWVRMAAAMSSLTQLQGFKLAGRDSYSRSGPLPVVRALAHLPSLHTLVVNDIVMGQEQLDALLAVTQITRLELQGFSGLTSSRASAACSWRWLEVRDLDWVTAAYLPLHSLIHPLRLQRLVKGSEEPSVEVLAAAELNLCERNKAGLVLDGALWLSKATVDLLTKQYLSHNRRTAQQPTHPTVASSRNPGGLSSSSGQGGQHGGSAAGAQALMQRLGRCVKAVHITVQGPGGACLPSANWQALAALFPTAYIGFSQ
ncbi:hypothetical protein QJQ45_010663 [Haematococcus lacustris]|nr:hypothetical protein QJQ45_010663 [Haematococcus lacustris]